MASREVLRGAFDTIYPAAVSRGQPARDPMVEIQEIRHDRKASASARRRPAASVGRPACAPVGAQSVLGTATRPGQPVHSFMLNCAAGTRPKGDASSTVVFLYPLDTR